MEFANAVLARADIFAALQGIFGNASTSTISVSLDDCRRSNAAGSTEAKWRLGYLCHGLARHFDRRESGGLHSLAKFVTAPLFFLQISQIGLEELRLARPYCSRLPN